MPGFGYDRPGFDHPGWVGLVWGVLPAVLFAALIALIVFLFVRAGREPYGHRPVAAPLPPDGALGEARMRYARGEIAREDYLRIAQDLGPGGSPPAPDAPAPA